MRNFFELVIGAILATLVILILAAFFIFSLGWIISVFPSQGNQGAIIERVYVDGFINKTNEIEVFPIKMGDSSDFYTIEDPGVLANAKVFLSENKKVLITYHCGVWNPYRSASLGCFADKITEVK